MFSHLCRACLTQFNDPADIVPLFESHENVFYYQMCNELHLSVQQDDQLGCNVCRTCSEMIMKFYNFVLTYKECEGKLRDMLKSATVAVDEMIEFKPNIVDLVNQHQVITETVGIIKTEMNDNVDTKQFPPKKPITDPIAVNWKCSKCFCGFPTRNGLDIHRKSHLSKPTETISKNPQCSICLNKFPSRKMLEKHNREQHSHEQSVRKSISKGTAEYECDQCSKRFNTKTKIKQHLITHFDEGRRKFLCVSCGNQFCSKFGLIQHISAIHEREQKFQCTKCNRRFAHKHNLKTHMNRHNGIRPYACTVCVKTFYDSSTLNVHTKSVHSGTNAYVCNICNKGFNRNGNLKIHMVKTHHIQNIKSQGSNHRVVMKVE